MCHLTYADVLQWVYEAQCPLEIKSFTILDLVGSNQFLSCSMATHWLRGKESASDAGDTGSTGSIPGSGRSPEGGHGHPLQCSCPENLVDRGAWQDAVHRDTVGHNWSSWTYMHAWLCHSFKGCALPTSFLFQDQHKSNLGQFQEGLATPRPFPHILSYIPLPSGCFWVISFVINS